ncbi:MULTISPECIES: hypothetical protein [Sporomusa]|uniref:Uncharacterized protein n=1 Tax=Sporomusa sphaeroides DSM 2875 TaxID=1337886 RepID=A0ABM9VXQ6_9FIRM|nr:MULTISPECIES: hypothetical protein [Sporomusa]MCM0760159.1 hypothetical protein [Sporomusa sphaeroides DSM 2875]OLS58192.1 hypothetical protein SPSPH_17280 [Sporomusa sphaeroides DSM 2875]CVK17621.1 hypothetical protein SSPH_00255 [Sporomusa sphaeroides DSM 2875]HML31525.1 hypothetical protein [Sporomusa sphaeroides]
MDTVAQPLSEVINKLEQNDSKYTVTITKPSRNMFQLDDTLYVIRQQVDADGIYHLIAAAKMGKEVF